MMMIFLLSLAERVKADSVLLTTLHLMHASFSVRQYLVWPGLGNDDIRYSSSTDLMSSSSLLILSPLF